MKCPKCNSENTQRLEVVYEAGTSHGTHESESTTFFNSFGTGNGVGNTTTHGSSVNQSILAKRAAPPKKTITIKECLGWLASIVIFSLTYLIFSSVFLITLGNAKPVWSIILVIILFYIIIKRLKFIGKLFTDGKYEESYQKWKNSWMCSKCGTIYEQHQN